MASAQLRSLGAAARQLHATRRSFTTTIRRFDAAVPATSKSETSPALRQESQTSPIEQAPNRAGIWSRSQNPRSSAMTGPRFEQTDFDLQPQPLSAMDMIHKEPVRWTHDRIVACDGGGGPNGHPRIFINTDKPEIAVCNYCGLPYANERHRKYLQSLPATSYPLS